MGKYQAYPEYVDSSGAWDEKVPSHWRPSQLKFLLSRNDGGVWGNDGVEGDTPVLRSTEITQAGDWSIDDPAYRKLSPHEHKAGLLIEGDLLITKSSGSEAHIGKTALVDSTVAAIQPAFSNFMQRLRLSNFGFPRYVFYLLNNIYGKEQLNYLSSTTTGLKNLSRSVLAEIQVPGAPLAEQEQIAAFLDHETARIDTLIEKQEKLIALLKEKRQAVISHAVTKGLDPNAPMKESGVEWLEEVPEGWRIARLKHVATILDCKHLTADFVDDGVPLASIREVQSWHVDLSSAKQTTNEFFSRLTEGNRKPQPGDIIYSRNATVGQAALVSEDHPDFTMGQDVCLIRSDMGVLPSLLMYHFISGHMVNQLDCAMVGATFKRVNVEEIKNFWIVIPPIESQTELLAYLAEKTAKFDKLMGDAGSIIELLQERSAALISAAVTGKIDVRNHPSARAAA